MDFPYRQSDDFTVTFDYDADTIVLRNVGGTVITTKPLKELNKNHPIRSMTYHSHSGYTSLVFRSAKTAGLELPTAYNSAPLEDRKVVYLDQHHWAEFSRAINFQTLEFFATESASSKVDYKTYQAYAHLRELVEDDFVVLPLAHTHLLETAAIEDEVERRELGELMLSMSGGWQMLDPVSVMQQAHSAEDNDGYYGMHLFSPFNVKSDTHKRVVIEETLDSEFSTNYVEDQLFGVARVASMLLQSKPVHLFEADDYMSDDDYFAVGKSYADFALGSQRVVDSSRLVAGLPERAVVCTDIVELVDALDAVIEY